MRAFNLLLLIFILIIPLRNYSQTKHVENEVIGINSKLSESLSQYELGSGFTIILFEYIINNQFKGITVQSSNFKSRAIIEKFINSSHPIFEIKNAKPGFFALPIIQIMFDDNGGDKAKPEDLNWSNNNFFEMTRFTLLEKMSQHTIFLRPIIIMGSPPISKK